MACSKAERRLIARDRKHGMTDPAYQIIIRAIHCDGERQRLALRHLEERGLWLTDDQMRQAKVKRVRDLVPGDRIDLQGDRPEFATEYALVTAVVPETGTCTLVYIEGVGGFGFPPHHMVPWCGRDEAYVESETAPCPAA